MNVRNKNEKSNIKTPNASLKKINTCNLFTSYKKNLTSSKSKFFSISSKEDIIKNKYKNCFFNNEPKVLKNVTIKREIKRFSANCIETPKYYSHNISKFKIKYNTTDKIIKSIKKVNNKRFSLLKKNKFKDIIIIDNEGNNNLNINKKIFMQSTSLKECRLNSKKNNKNNMKLINNFKTNKRSVDARNDIIQNLLNFYKTENLETISSTITETNSLFLNSKNIKDRQEIRTNNFLNIKEDDNISTKLENNINQIIKNKKINEYNKIIDLVKINMSNIKNKNKCDENKKSLINSNNNITDYNSFIKNIPKYSRTNSNNYIDNKENFDINFNNNELKSFLESSLHDDFYQSLVYKKSFKNKNKDDDSINLSKSLSESIDDKMDKKQYDFEKIIHPPVKKNNLFSHLYNTEKIYKNSDNKEKHVFNTINKLDIYDNEKNNLNNRNVLCTIF